MDRNEAIRAHTDWKKGLSAYLKNPNGSLSPSEVERADACELARWMDGEGEAQFSTDMAFQHLRWAHSRFHRCAADIVRRANGGERVSLDTSLGAHSDYADASSEVVTSLMALPISGHNVHARRPAPSLQ